MTAEQLTMLAEILAECSRDPLKFVKAAFNWGHGTLEGKTGPEEWQKELLCDIRDGLLTTDGAIREATRAGHGVGKSALVAWLILWAISTHEDTRGVVTANTETQLRTKTWPELVKWYNMSIVKDVFECTSTSIFSKDKEHEKTWRIDAIAWSETNPEAFAGLHNQGNRTLIIFDEASAIPEIIWDTAEGATTDADTEIIFAVFGNPTQNTGKFHDCFFKDRNYWRTRRVDSRTVRFSNKNDIEKWRLKYGEDSDFFKIRVLGEFPSSSELQFIPKSYVDEARGKHLKAYEYNFAPVIIGVDPAWTGGDEIAIFRRQGLWAKMLATYPKNDDDFEMANRIAQFEDRENADAVIIDIGFGTGIYSAGKYLGRKWMLVSFSEKSPDPGYANMRAYGWGKMKAWLAEGGAIPDDEQLCNDLIGPETVPRDDGKIQLESKDKMKSRGLPSPNRADALAVTFMRAVRKKEQIKKQTWANNKPYDLFGE